MLQEKSKDYAKAHPVLAKWFVQIALGMVLLPFVLVILWLAPLALDKSTTITVTGLTIVVFANVIWFGAVYLTKHGFRFRR